jgi:hypothetical protein
MSLSLYTYVCFDMLYIIKHENALYQRVERLDFEYLFYLKALFTLPIVCLAARLRQPNSGGI